MHLSYLALVSAAVFVLAAPSYAVFAVGSADDVPAGVTLKRPVNLARFLAHENENKCTREVNKNRGYWFVPVQPNEDGVTFNQCEIGEPSLHVACRLARSF